MEADSWIEACRQGLLVPLPSAGEVILDGLIEAVMKGQLPVAQHIWSLCGNRATGSEGLGDHGAASVEVSVHARDHALLRAACQSRRAEVVAWVASLCPSCRWHLRPAAQAGDQWELVDKWELFRELAELGQYDEVLRILALPELDVPESEPCHLCDGRQHLVLLSCRHTACAACLLQWYLVSQQQSAQICPYCRQPVELSRCRSLVRASPFFRTPSAFRETHRSSPL